MSEPPNRAVMVVVEGLASVVNAPQDATADELRTIAQRAGDDFVAMSQERSNASGPNFQPDLSDPAQALARRVQEALEITFDGEELFPCVVVVQHLPSMRVGIAGTMTSGLEDVNALLLLGRGAALRALREAGQL